MSALIRHTNCEPQRPLWKTAAYLFALIASLVYLLKVKAVRYTYLLIEDELIFYKQVGKKEAKVLNVRMNEIEWLRPIESARRLEKCEKTYILTCKTKGAGVYIGQFKQNGECYRFIIQPCPELYSEIIANI